MRLAAGTDSDPAEALDRALAAAEAGLRRGEMQAAETLYREALFEGWLLVAPLERLERRPSEATAATTSSS